MPLFKGLCVVGFKGCEGSIEHFPARHYYDVQSRPRLERRSDLMAPEQLPRQALRAISTNGRSQLPAGGHTQSRVGRRIRNDDDCHEPRVDPTTFRIGPVKFRAAANSLAGCQTARVGHD